MQSGKWEAMKRSWPTIVLFGGLVVLLAALGALQYHWQSQISENQREKLRRSLYEDASRFASDFNREIQNAYFNFQMPTVDWKAKNYNAFAERYEYWRTKTKYPELVSNFYFFEAVAGSSPLEYDRERRTFHSVEWNNQLRALRSRIINTDTFLPVYSDIYTLVLPVNETPKEWEQIVLRRTPDAHEAELDHIREMHKPVKFGYLVILLNEDVIRGQIFPDLASQYFGDGEFTPAVITKDGSTIYGHLGDGMYDASIPFFSLSPADFIVFSNRDLVSSLEERRRSGVVVNERFESRTSRVETSKDGVPKVKIEVQEPGSKPRTSVFTATTSTQSNDGSWFLNVSHTAGSIDQYIASMTRRNLGIGFGILALLGIAIAAIIFSTQRARSFAQRQIDFVSSVSHEFRTPLAVIYSAGENLADGVTNDAAQTSKYGELIKREGRKLSAMVEQILEFAGANSGRQTYRFGRASVKGIVESAVQESRPLLDDHEVEIATSIADPLPPIRADAEAVSRALQNLIANSVKYRNGNNWIRVSASNGYNSVKISVEDGGIGISKSDLRRVFEPFYRSKDVVDAQIHGNGLGLSLVQQIVKAHGGRVTAESELGKGSKFTIELPNS